MSENSLRPLAINSRNKRPSTYNTNNKATVSRYAQGIYNPKSNSNKRQVLGETTSNVEPPTKRSKTGTTSVLIPPATQSKPVNHVAAAKQALKEKQQIKDRRSRKTGTLPNYSHVKSKVNTNIVLNRSTDSITYNANDSTIIDDSMDIDVSSISHSNSRISTGSNTSVMSTSTLVHSKLKSPTVASLRRATRLSKLPEIARSNSLAINISPVRKELKRSFTFPSVYNENSRTFKPLLPVKPKLEYKDPIKVEEYAAEIYIYWKELEIQTLPDSNYMTRQPELDWGMQTLYLATNLIDRTLTCKSISMSKLQLVGVTSLLIASKYEEIQSPMISDMVYMTANGYKEEEIKTAERHLLGIVSYKSRLLVDISGYHEAQLLDCVYALLEFLNTEENMTAYEKADGSESSEGDIIIDISDNDTVSTLESEPEEEKEEEIKIEPEHPPAVEKKIIKLQKKESRVKKSWADDPIDNRERKEKRYSESFNRRSNDNATSSSKWAHDLFNEDDSDDDQERARPYKRNNKNKKKDKSRKSAPADGPKDKETSRKPVDNRSVPDLDLPSLKQLNIEEKKEEVVEQPKVRRVLSQASKNQLLASISRSEARPIDRSTNEAPSEKVKEKSLDVRSEKTEEKTERMDKEKYENIRLERNGERERNDLARQERNGERTEQLRLERNEQLKNEKDKEYSDRKDRSRDRSERYDRKEKERYDRNQKSSEVTLVDRNNNRSPKLDKQPKYEREVMVHEKIVVEKRAKPNLKRNSTSSQANDHTSNASHEKSDNPEELHDQIISTGNGWAIYNPSPKIELDMKKEVKSKSYDSNRKKRPATFQPPQQLINVQPMITQSGQMVLLTETGLMVPATPDMFQSYQQQYMYPPPTEQTPYAYSYPPYYPGDGAAPNPEVSKKIS
ncbi:G2/mitotic-specific cyclin [Boothiomyces sp. JEL0866]|nr:G2/mitotic-specific cyclin [Boothiomyces sp. JEL0866]